MFEAHVLHLLKRYLGEYVQGLSVEALRISVWKGDVVLKDLKLKTEALSSLKLPVNVKAGFIGSITLKVPWKSLGKEPVIVLIDRVFILAHPSPDTRSLKDEDKNKLFEAKLKQIEEAESATLDALSRSQSGSPSSNSWLGSLISTIIGNLKLSITNVHVRYEDSISHMSHPFCSGITLAKLAAVTTDERGNETFDTSGALDKLSKSVELERLAVYHDSNREPWNVDKKWEDLTPCEWIEIFEDGINESLPHKSSVSKWAQKRNYVVFPINGVLKYHRLGKQERNDPSIPIEKASLVLSDVMLKISEIFSRYRTYIEFSHIRPAVPISENPKLWWRYGAQAALQQKKLCYKLSWDQIHYLCQLRRRYVQLYSTSLQRPSSDSMLELREMEKQLDPKVILLWRLLAHAKAETLKTKEALEKKKTKSWFSLNWYGDNKNSSDESFLELPQITDDGFSREEWRAINNLLSFQSEDDSYLLYGQDNHNVIQYLITVSIEKVAARIVDISDTEIVYGTFEHLTASTKIKSRSTQCDLLLKYYGLSAPEGSLAQSVSSEHKVNALCACFVYSPMGENVDWKLSATISPSHVTVLMESFDRIFDFMKRSNAVSPTVALETANVLQTKIEKVTRRAQEQFQLVMEEQSRFALDIDFDAPKVCVPMMLGHAKYDMNFVLDFGHFKLHTMNDYSDVQNQSIYTKFQITGRDIAAFFTDCNSDVLNSSFDETKFTETDGNISSLIDRCGVTVVIEQIKVPHPSYPPSRVSIQVPNLGVHFSPMRYRGIMELMNILYATMENYNQSSTDNVYSTVTPWNGTDISSDARILVWKGIGHSIATWQSCFIVLTGSYLYAMECQNSPSYQRYLSLSGKQVVEVPSISIGGSQHCLAVSYRGMDIQQALESSSTWVLELRDEEEKDVWLRSLVQSTYLTSAPASIDVLGESQVVSDGMDVPQSSSKRKVDRIINGTVVETKVFMYAKNEDEDDESSEESMIIEIMGGGGKVYVVQSDGDLTVKMKMHSFNVKDSLQCRQSNTSRYLAYSVNKDSKLFFPENCDKQNLPIIQDEDDNFTDALPDFLFFQDNSLLSSDIGNSLGIEFPESFLDIQENISGNMNSGEIFYEAYDADDADATDFVSINFSTRSSSSPDYDGIDTQMTVCMSKLEFFCNRPTIVALIGFGLDVGRIETNRGNDFNPPIKEKFDKTGRVKGLLGFGKSRVVFLLVMNVDSVSVILNKEDGSQLATLVQENFLLDIKVHPSSISIEGTLGNFKLCDMSLGENNNWSWLCDIRNPGVESLIKFEFCSYSPEDDDYSGYDYCLSGRLSAVRIVFLYKFVQEITEYFMGLASPHSEEAIKLVDKVGGFEWLIHKYEIDGATAIKLDLSLDTPIIIIPKSSRSKEFIQLDLGLLNVKNDFIWYGQPENNPSAIHMDILHAAIIGINMAVGEGGCMGKPMIRDGQGLNVCVRRSLRDIFRKVPSFSVELKIGHLHGVMSDREYNVILDCTYMNINEEPTLPPSFRGSKSGSNNSMRSLVDKVNLNSQTLLSHTVTVMQVDVNNALLELCNGAHESPLASLSINGLWVSYRMTSFSETDLYVSIPSFSISDIRPDTKSEMRLLLGSSADVPKSVSCEVLANFQENRSPDSSMKSDQDTVETNLTMLLMDYRWRESSQSCVFRLQQPRILVVPDFLLAVGGFFVPAIKSITGREDSMDPENDPINGSNSILLTDPVYKQEENVVNLSPFRQLVADTCEIDEYVYDGCGKTISLSVEHDLKNRNRPIIYIGRGKKLRFLNVKIENAALLKSFVYLSNDSSYSILEDDGVHISLSESSLIDIDEIIVDHAHLYRNDGSGLENKFNLIQSFTFDVQIVSPEFTFYDSTKSTLDDSFYGEKLLRAKLDLNFMYASKDNDTWIRVLAKDLNLEAGSGLVILNPMDISGAYTSVKEKTNMSLVSTDICIHLSFGVISLLLNLQNQALAALEFGNGIPLVPCTNFYRIWVSSKENSDGFNLTFWRPQPPSSYVVLGDCVTSRSTPPSQAVMAVGNVYGRVKKPIGFNFVCVLSCVRGISTDVSSMGDCDCSLWMPIPSPGYVALGCVVNIGNQPPPIHIVYCLRHDLVASTRSSECMFMAPGSKQYALGFSIWRVDNTISSFYAHSSSRYPPSNICFDLNQSLLWSNTRHHSSNELSARTSTEFDDNSQQSTDKRSSGWDVLRSVSRVSDYFMSTPNFERIWWDKGSDMQSSVSIWRPVTRPGYSIVGDCIIEGLDPPTLGVLIKNDDSESCAKPVQFTKVAKILGKPNEELYFWYPVAIPGYVSMGCVVTRVDKPPRLNLCYCPRIDIVSQANIADVPVARSNSKSSQSWSVWKVENQACTFLAHSDLKKPVSSLGFAIGDCSKPKSRQNITSDLKLRFCSITVSDSLCGKMTPLFDITVTNIKLATHGNLKAMNAVLVSSVAASSFNTRIEAWEPLVEPFDGIFKFETYVTDAQPTSRFAKRVSLAAASIVNVNLSAANLEAFVGATLSWKMQLELDEKASKRMGYGSSNLQHDAPMNSAIDEDDFQSVLIENHLGCDLQLKRVVDSPGKVTIINDGDLSSCWVPPPKVFHRLTVTNDGRDARYYVAVRILEAKGLPIVEDDINLNLFCALRLVVDCQKADQERLFPQSARTKCVKYSDVKENEFANAQWNELFIAEIPRKAPAKLEFEVTNLSANAGKGEVVGAVSLPIRRDTASLKKVMSTRMLNNPSTHENFVSLPLTKRHGNDVEESGGVLVISTVFFDRHLAADIDRETEYSDSSNNDVGFCIRLDAKDAWLEIRSLLPVSVIPLTIQNEFIAMEVMLKDGKKHVIYRGLANVKNELDVKLEVCVCDISYNEDVAKAAPRRIAIDEIFENQRNHPIFGWGNKWQNLKGNDPVRWSSRDFSISSKDFFEPPLPPGWQWTSSWIIDKSESVDSDGWAYGYDFGSFKWPPAKSRGKSGPDTVRRRRWIRQRQEVNMHKYDNNNLLILKPGSSVTLPWKSIVKNSNHILLVRPFTEDNQNSYPWGQEVVIGKSQHFSDQDLVVRHNTDHGSKTRENFKLNQLEKKDVLLCCNSSETSKFWLSISADASILHTELNEPVYDWKLSVNSPLKLENQLPCPMEFTIWEKSKEQSCVERQNGIVSPRNCAYVCMVDISKPIYLTLLLQGGWVLEKDPVLVLDLSSSEHVSSFIIFSQQSKRKVRVSIERDMGGTISAQKIIRFFVPYWIVNDSSLPLTYRLMEIENSDVVEVDPLLFSRVKSSKATLSVPTMERKRFGVKRNDQNSDVIEDESPLPTMLSLHEGAAQSGPLSFTSHKESYLNPRIGISVAMRDSEDYSPGISLLELEKKERVEVKAFSADGCFYMLSVLLKTSERTKVVHFQPQAMFINRIGLSLCLRQCDFNKETWIHPSDPYTLFSWHLASSVELLTVMIDGYEWSSPFSISKEGRMRIILKAVSSSKDIQLRVHVRSGTKTSRYEVIFSPDCSSSPYRIENRSMLSSIYYRQVDGTNDTWKFLPPNAAVSFLWEDLGRRKLLELSINEANKSKSFMYDVDEVCDHNPIQVSTDPTKFVRVTIIKDDKTNAVQIKDWIHENVSNLSLLRKGVNALHEIEINDEKKMLLIEDSEFHFIVELSEFGLSVVDHSPEEILYLSLQNFLLGYSSGLGSGFSRIKLRMHGIQIDNQLPLTPMPVLFRPQKVGEESDAIIKLSVTLQSSSPIDSRVFPYIGFTGPDDSAFVINVHEPIIWRIHEMLNQINVSSLYNTDSAAVSVDPIIQIGVVNISEVRFKVSMTMSPGQRPKGVLGFWSSLMTALGNTENMPVKINPKYNKNICMRQSAMISRAISNVMKDILGQPLQLLSGVDILGNAVSALGHMSKGVAALSMDKKFIQSRRQRQESKGVEDFGDVIREGGGALAKGLFRGVTGILTKPLEGAKSSGVEGFVQGVGKGIIGAAAQPVSGVLDLLSKTTEGANAMRMKIISAITSEEQLLRRRLPRVIGGDSLLRPYDEYKSQGQVILQLAESGSFLGQVDLFKVRGKFALSDAYEDHFMLPKGKIVVVTHRRVMLLQQPLNIISQRKFSPVRDPCSVIWDVLWDDLVTMEMQRRKKDSASSPPSVLVIYLKESTRIIKCCRDTDQAFRIYSAVQKALTSFGSATFKESLRNRVAKPYSPAVESSSSTVDLLVKGNVSATLPSSFGTTL